MNKFRKKSLSKFGEFELIDFIKKNNTLALKNHNVNVDIGDDCFCFNSHKNAKYLVTTDILIENVHFKKDWSSPETIARKAIEVNVSDIASMGSAKPLYAFLSIGISRNTSKDYIKRFFKSLKQTCRKYSVHIAGGDTVRADFLTISVTLIGVSFKNVIKRTDSKKDDIICVSGTFGDSGAGFDILSCARRNLKSYEKRLVQKHLSPKSALKTANLISEKIKITSMTDSSDGLFKSLELLTSSFNKGADIDLSKIPISEDLKKFTKYNVNKMYKYALFGAEEFELVFTVNPKDVNKLNKLFPHIVCIGNINDSGEVAYFENGKKQKIAYEGFVHF